MDFRVTASDPNGSLLALLTTAILDDMKKRVTATVLWFFAAWYAGAMLAYILGVSVALGPILGTAAAALIAGDPRGIIWTRREVTRTSTASPHGSPTTA